ncbi:MAG: hypothetical protein JNM47_08615 [Hyphomonadaceae bacterium]|nr:hypothetical protein [Hyphomonadaceae bacterium]
MTIVEDCLGARWDRLLLRRNCSISEKVAPIVPRKHSCDRPADLRKGGFRAHRSREGAEEICPRVVVEARGRWNGRWRIAEPGRTSCCEVTDFAPPAVARRAPPAEPRTRAVEAGAIWNQRDAEVKCRARAEQARGEWTGRWRTVTPGRMFVCDIAVAGARTTPWPRYFGPARSGTRTTPIRNVFSPPLQCKAAGRASGKRRVRGRRPFVRS